jgi:hypothetical protein
LVIALGMAGTAAAEERSAGLELSSTMGWEQIGRAMEAYPPSFEHGDQRLKIMQSMDGRRYGRHHPDGPTRSSETIRYLFRLGGITFLQSAESHTEADDWLEKAADLGWNVDVLFKPGQYQGARSVMEFLAGHDYFHLPIHEYELMHERGGNRTAPLLEGGSRDAFDRKRSMPLLWGEDFLLRRG